MSFYQIGWYTTAEKRKLYFLKSLNHVDFYLKPWFLTKSSYYIVPSPSTALVKITTVPTCSQSSPLRLWHYELANLKKEENSLQRRRYDREDDGFLRPVFRILRLVHPQASDIRAASTTYLLPASIASTASHWRLISSPHCMLVGASAYGDFCPWFFSDCLLLDPNTMVIQEKSH